MKSQLFKGKNKAFLAHLFKHGWGSLALKRAVLNPVRLKIKQIYSGQILGFIKTIKYIKFNTKSAKHCWLFIKIDEVTFNQTYE
ncbi:MAG: hypothetical protein V7K50_27355 [Nostoc sp.]|uniref:hypothetical protein n=1 Tax=Nostoc sp. TaxID=1180 RepID=UPI002FF4A83A